MILKIKTLTTEAREISINQAFAEFTAYCGSATVPMLNLVVHGSFATDKGIYIYEEKTEH